MTTVVAAIIESGGKVLIGRRAPHHPHPGKWEFPGGKVEPGETPEEALRRELEEELGIKAEIGPEVTRYEYSYPGRKPILLIFYAVSRLGGYMENRIFADLAWARKGELPSYDFLDGDVDFVKHLAEQSVSQTPGNQVP